MSRWFRHYAGMMRDEKLVRAAMKAKQPVERVVWVWGAILESAAEIDDGGRYELDAAEVAYFLRTDEADIRAIEDALAALERVASGSVVKWGDRQFQSDKSRERQARYRENRKQPGGSDGDGVAPSRDGGVTERRCDSDAPETETETEVTSEVQALTLIGGASETVRPNAVRTNAGPSFDDFWKAYPTDALMSKKKAAAEWRRLSAEKRAAALASCAGFRAHCSATPDYRPVHACRYLSEERFVGFVQAEAKVAASASVHIMAGAPGWQEWQAVKKTPTDAKGGWWFPSPYPPGLHEVA
jgi:hypothetical protein